MPTRVQRGARGRAKLVVLLGVVVARRTRSLCHLGRVCADRGRGRCLCLLGRPPRRVVFCRQRVERAAQQATDDGRADEGGDRCAAPMRVDLAAYVACGASLIDAAQRVLKSDIGASPCAVVLLDVVRDTLGLLAAATADAMSDWFAPLAPMRALLNAPLVLSACRVLSPMGALFETTRADPAGALVPCFAPSHEAFVAALAADSPRLVDAILSTGVLGPGAVLAGGAVVNAMQSPTLRRRLDDSDVDMWIVGDDEHRRRRTFARVIGALFDALPGARVTVRGSVVTFAIGDGGDNAGRDRDGTSTSGSDGFDPDGGPRPRAIETLQVIYTDVQTAHDVIDDFDMTHACAYYDGTDVCASWACVWTVVSRMTVALPGIAPNPRRIARAAAKGFAFAPSSPGAEAAAHPDTETPDRTNNDTGNEQDSGDTSVPLDHEATGTVKPTDDGHADGNDGDNGKSDAAMGRDINLPGNDYGSLWGMTSDPEPVAYDSAAALLGRFTHASMVSNSNDVFPKLEVTLQTEVTPLAAIARVRVPPMRASEPMVCTRCRAPDAAPKAWCIDSRRCAGRGDRLADDGTRVVTVIVADDDHAARVHACASRLRTMDAEIEALHEALSRESPTANQWGDSVPWVPMIATLGPVAVVAADDNNNAKPERWRMHLRYTRHTTIRCALTGEILARGASAPDRTLPRASPSMASRTMTCARRPRATADCLSSTRRTCGTSSEPSSARSCPSSPFFVFFCILFFPFFVGLPVVSSFVWPQRPPTLWSVGSSNMDAKKKQKETNCLLFFYMGRVPVL